MNTARVRGALVGTAVGDALGLPAEGLGPARSARLLRRPWRHRLVFGRGMLSDDTEHTVFVAQALLAAGADVEAFTRRLAWSLRWWLVALPAGVGLATLRAILKLWLGLRPPRSAVRSAGNGAAMRVAPIGARFAADEARLDEFVRAATTVTHGDPRALVGARAVARMVAWGVRHGAQRRPARSDFVALLQACGDDAEWRAAVEQLELAARDGESVQQCALRLRLGRGVSGYVYHTVPVAAYAWWHHYQDFRAGLIAVLDLGGDADTVGAITGALLGAACGEEAIPREWCDGIRDWPRGLSLVRQLADRLAAPEAAGPVAYAWAGVVPRNLFFLVVVLLHGFRRLLPPY